MVAAKATYKAILWVPTFLAKRYKNRMVKVVTNAEKPLKAAIEFPNNEVHATCPYKYVGVYKPKPGNPAAKSGK